MEDMCNDLGAEIGTNVAEEATHLAPIVGYAVSAFVGLHPSRKQYWSV